MTTSNITPEEAKRLIDQGALLIDVRQADEHAREKIPGSRNIALAALTAGTVEASAGRPVVFYCKSGLRTANHAPQLAEAVRGGEARIVEGGLDAWRKAGLPVAVDRGQPLELQRQVQIGAGSIVLIGTLLGAFASPWFLLIPAFVGAGLTMAGVTGFCGMALALRHMPWNRQLMAS